MKKKSIKQTYQFAFDLIVFLSKQITELVSNQVLE